MAEVTHLMIPRWLLLEKHWLAPRAPPKTQASAGAPLTSPAGTVRRDLGEEELIHLEKVESCVGHQH